VDTDTTRKLFGLLGLGVRGRGAIIGVEQVRESARRGKLVLAIAAPDASSNSLDKVLPLLRAREIPVFAAPSARELGNAVGRDTAAVVGIVDRGLAKGIRALSLSAMPEARKEELG
jgi:ribosomal protein L7Ae-like RNA K-turn-binding protein